VGIGLWELRRVGVGGSWGGDGGMVGKREGRERRERVGCCAGKFSEPEREAAVAWRHKHKMVG
jgi:hypothetical protein